MDGKNVCVSIITTKNVEVRIDEWCVCYISDSIINAVSYTLTPLEVQREWSYKVRKSKGRMKESETKRQN